VSVEPLTNRSSSRPQEMKKLYENNGSADTKVEIHPNIEVPTHPSQIHVPVKIKDIEFRRKCIQAKLLRAEIKTAALDVPPRSLAAVITRYSSSMATVTCFQIPNANHGHPDSSPRQARPP